MKFNINNIIHYGKFVRIKHHIFSKCHFSYKAQNVITTCVSKIIRLATYKHTGIQHVSTDNLRFEESIKYC